MFRSGLRARPSCLHLRLTSFGATGSRESSRRFTDQTYTRGPDLSEYRRVRIIGPAVWSISVVGTIYFGCAAFDVYQDAKKWAASKGSKGTVTFDEIELARTMSSVRTLYRETSSSNGPFVFSTPWSAWNNLDGPHKLVASVTVLNTGSLLIYKSRFPPLEPWYFVNFTHMPVMPKNFTLFTSMFAHTGGFHLAVNMFVFYNLGITLARGPTFNNSGSHLTAFYLSSGVMASLGLHLSTCFWPNKMARFIPACGASGAISAIFAACVMVHPHREIGFVFLPWSWPAEDVLKWSAIFEAAGVMGLFRRIPMISIIAHAAHLSGIGIGWAYVKYGGKENIWTPSRRIAFNTMRRLKMA